MNTNHTDSLNEPTNINELQFNLMDLFKVLWEWLFSFRRIYYIKPGLYYTGDKYDITTPLLVTANYHLTVWTVWRRIKHLNTRVLVIDTDGINVWCSSGKGRFCAEEILLQLDKYPKEVITRSEEIQLILPKLSLSGVKLSDLRKHNIKPIIGPVYAGDIPNYLNNPPYRDCNEQIFQFDLLDRLFTLVPSWVQIITYSSGAAFVLFILNIWLKIGIWWQVYPIGVILTTLYVLLFPYLPTRSFVYKGFFLFLMTGFVYLIYSLQLHQTIYNHVFYLSYIAGFSVFYGLYYTGNSGVSNYSIVKRETVLFFPVVIILFLASLVSVILKGVLS